MRLFGRTAWSLESVTPPWGDVKSIYDHIREDPKAPLPDEDIVFSRAKVKWVGGAMDGVLGSRAEGAEAENRALKVVQLLMSLQRRADNKSLKELYENLIQDGLISHIDSVLERLTKSDTSYNQLRMSEIGRYFAIRAGHREAVKFGIAMVGLYGRTEDLEFLKILAGNDEFTLFAAIAIARIADNPEQEFWQLAKRVHGWGRVQVVRRLQDTENPEIQAWMLRDGFRNDIMLEYLACICARTGRLHEALNRQFVDTALLDGAADIIRALIAGGPAEGIDDYEFAPDVCESFLNIVAFRSDATLQHFLAVATLRNFLSEPSGWEQRIKSRWTGSPRQTLLSLADNVFGEGRWREQVDVALASSDEETFFVGDTAAHWLGIDTWDKHFERVKAAPLASSSWYRLMKQTDETRIDRVLALAESVLPFDQIELGPGDELGLGPEFQPHGVLDYVLQDLRRFPDRGWRLIKAGLRSPVVRNRNMAIYALGAWSRKPWNDEIRSSVEHARDAEPDGELKQRLASLLLGTPLL